DRLRAVIEKDLVEKIEHTTPEEFSRYVGRRKRDLLAALDPADKQFTKKQTDAMHNVWCEGPVRGNQNAHKWVMIVDAEAHEAFIPCNRWPITRGLKTMTGDHVANAV